MTPSGRAIGRIAKVNHAGEYGAIRIYGAQMLVARMLWPDLVPMLRELREHEIVHCRLFREAMPARSSRPCRIMPLWSVGGWGLGFFTALLGPKSIWSCTEVVEATVHRHLEDQIAFLDGRDSELRDTIVSIRDEEEGHLRPARREMGTSTPLLRALQAAIQHAVDGAIWLSTWGDSAAMRRDLRQGVS